MTRIKSVSLCVYIEAEYSPLIAPSITMYHFDTWFTFEDPKIATSLKCQYQDQLYSLGAPPVSYPALRSLISTAIPYIQSSPFSVLYKDPDGDLVEITTTESMLEAYQLCPGLMKVYISKGRVYQEPAQPVILDSTIDLKLIFHKLNAVFTICLEKKAVGMGVVVEGNLAVTTAPAVQQVQAASVATALFQIPGFEYAFNPNVRFIRQGQVTILAFKSALPSEIQPLVFRNDFPKRGSTGLILHQPVADDPKSALKWVEIKDSSPDSFHYDSKEPGGPAGSPVFNESLELLGIQVTECVQSNSALPGVAIQPLLPQVDDVIVVGE